MGILLVQIKHGLRVNKAVRRDPELMNLMSDLSDSAQTSKQVCDNMVDLVSSFEHVDCDSESIESCSLYY